MRTTGKLVSEVKELVSNVSLVRNADLLPTGYIRLETVFRYPDGSSIDVFLAPQNLLPGHRLTDLAQTTAWLLDVQVKPWLSKKRRMFVEDAIRTLGVAQKGGELFVDVSELSQIADAVTRLGQACLRVADLLFTRRASLQTSFAEDIEEVLADADLPYESAVDIEGRYGRVVRVDFSVQGARARSLVLGLSSHNASAAHTAANEIFRKWHDLREPQRTEQRVTLFDDRSNAYRDDDLKRLEEVSVIVPFSDREGVRELLAA